MRLTNEMRGKLVNAMLTHKFTTDYNDLVAVAAQLAIDVYDRAFEKDRKQIDALPDGWLPTDCDITAKLGVVQPKLMFSGQFIYRHGTRLIGGVSYSEADIYLLFPTPAAVWRRFPNKRKGQCVLDLDGTDQLTKDYDNLVFGSNQFVVDVSVARRTLVSTLDQYHTAEKLVAAWPEIAPFVDDLEPARPKNLPALPVEDLNKMLGLPIND